MHKFCCSVILPGYNNSKRIPCPLASDAMRSADSRTRSVTSDHCEKSFTATALGKVSDWACVDFWTLIWTNTSFFSSFRVTRNGSSCVQICTFHTADDIHKQSSVRLQTMLDNETKKMLLKQWQCIHVWSEYNANKPSNQFRKQKCFLT